MSPWQGLALKEGENMGDKQYEYTRRTFLKHHRFPMPPIKKVREQQKYCYPEVIEHTETSSISRR